MSSRSRVGRTPVEDLLACAPEGITLSWSSLLTGRPGETNSAFALVDQTTELGRSVWPQMSCRPLTIRLALDNPVALGTIPALREILGLAPHLREGRYRDSEWRARFRSDIDATWTPILERAVALVDGVADPRDGVSLSTFASDNGLSISDAFVDLALVHGLDTRFDIPVANLDEGDIAKLLQDPRTIIGLSDAGAHANQQCDASFASYLLGHWCRDRGVIPLEQAVWRLTGQPAAVYGIPDRGVVARARSLIWWRSTRRRSPHCRSRPCTTYPAAPHVSSREAPASIRFGSPASRRAASKSISTPRPAGWSGARNARQEDLGEDRRRCRRACVRRCERVGRPHGREAVGRPDPPLRRGRP